MISFLLGELCLIGIQSSNEILHFLGQFPSGLIHPAGIVVEPQIWPCQAYKGRNKQKDFENWYKKRGEILFSPTLVFSSWRSERQGILCSHSLVINPQGLGQTLLIAWPSFLADGRIHALQGIHGPMGLNHTALLMRKINKIKIKNKNILLFMSLRYELPFRILLSRNAHQHSRWKQSSPIPSRRTIVSGCRNQREAWPTKNNQKVLR